MYRWIILSMFVILIFTSTAYAHVAGSFGDFLLGIKDEATTEKLKHEIENTKEEIERLTPKVGRLEEQYNQNAEVANTKLKLYNTVGLDTYMNFILQSNNIVDIMANQRIVEKMIQEDLNDLNQLYLEYMSLNSAKVSMENYKQILNIMQNNLELRHKFLSANKDLTPEELASLLVIIWSAKTSTLDEILLEDSQLINQNITELVTRKTSDSPYRFEEDLLNRKSKLTYYFRLDHVYVYYQNDDADVILIGTMSKTDGNTASLQFESGFLNGVMLERELLEQMPGFKLELSRLVPNTKGFSMEQINGAILIQPEGEQTVD
jgi:Sec-independent protein translocase protein TatA